MMSDARAGRWPSREEWAENRTTIWSGMDNPEPASRRLSNYAADAEEAAVIAALRKLLTRLWG